MKKLQDILENKFLVKKNITKQNKTYKLYKREQKPTLDADIVYVLVESIEDYLNLCKQINFEPLKDIIKNISNDIDKHVVFARPVKPSYSKKDTITCRIIDGKVSNNIKDGIQNYILFSEDFDINNFNSKYWRKTWGY